MNRIVFGFALATLSIPQMSFAQDAIAKAELIAAIGKLSQRDVSLIGSIDEEVQEQPNGGGGAAGMQRIVISGMGSGASTEYRGDIEVMAAKSGELVIASKEELPGVKIFKTDEKVLSLQAHLEEPYSTAKLVRNVSKLVDWTALGSAVESAAKIRTSVKDNNTEFRVVMDASFIPKEATPMPPGLGAGGGPNVKIQVSNPMVPSIVELAAIITMNASKEIVGLEYSLQYDDPMKAMMAQAMKGGAGVGVVQLGAKTPKPAGEADLGKLIIYDFDMAAKPSQRVTEFMSQAKTMLKNRK